eukprot:CFRG4866T1
MSASELNNASTVRAINVTEFAASRALEVVSLLNAVDANGVRKRHVRRRAVSHAPRRRQLSVKQIEKQREIQSQTNVIVKDGCIHLANEKRDLSLSTGCSRRSRRKPGRLLLATSPDNAPAQQAVIPQNKKRTRFPRHPPAAYPHRRLETHIWHAKRMHMSKKWGVYIAESNTQRGERAAHMDVLKGCALHDASYLMCLEVRGCVCRISKLLPYTSAYRDGADVNMNDSSLYISKLLSHRQFCEKGDEGHARLYTSMNVCLGEISFMWKPFASNDHQHPSCRDVHTLRQLWLWIHPREYTDIYKHIMDAKDNIQDIPSSITITERSAELCRLSLYGPSCVDILSSVLHPPSHSSDSTEEISSQHIDDGHNRNEAVMRNLSDALDHSVTHMDVVDPRYHPSVSNPARERVKCKRRTVARKQGENISAGSTSAYSPGILMPQGNNREIVHVDKAFVNDDTAALKDVEVEGLFCENQRQYATMKKASDQTINSARGLFIVDRYRSLRAHMSLDGETTNLTGDTSSIPILLVKRAGLARGTACRTRGVTRCNGYGAGFDLILPSGYGMPFWMSLIFSGAHAFGQDLLRRVLLERNIAMLAPYNLTQEDVFHTYLDMDSKHNKYARTTTSKKHAGTSVSAMDVDNKVHDSAGRRLWNIVSTRADITLANNWVRSACLGKDKMSAVNVVLPIENVDTYDDDPSIGCKFVSVSIDMMHKGTPASHHLVYQPLASDYAAYSANMATYLRAETSELGTSNTLDRKLIGCVAFGGYSYTRACGSGTGFVDLGRLKEWAEEGRMYDFPAFVLICDKDGLFPVRPAYISVMMEACGATLT